MLKRPVINNTGLDVTVLMAVADVKDCWKDSRQTVGFAMPRTNHMNPV